MYRKDHLSIWQTFFHKQQHFFFAQGFLAEMDCVLGLEDLTIDDVTEAYRKITAHAALVSGTISSAPNGNAQPSVRNIRTEWSQRDIDCKEKTRFTRTFSVQDAGDKVVYVGCTVPQEISQIVWDVESPSGKKRVVVLKKKDKKGEDKQFLEIWNVKQKEKTIDVKALDKHGDIVGSDGQFGSLQWSQCENYLLYIAEKKKPKTAGFFDTASPTGEDKGDSAEVTLKGGEYLHRESWGEQLAERHHTVVCRLTVSSSLVTLLTQVPDYLSPGQALWGPADGEVVFVAWSHEPFRLGLKFCVERRSWLFRASFDGEDCEKLSEEGRAVRCPSFSPDLSRLVYLDTPEGGAHNQCSRLIMIDWKKWTRSEVKAAAREVIVDIVHSPYKSGYDPGCEELPGLYTWADQSSQRNWLGDGLHVVLTSYCRSRSAVLMVNTDTKRVRNLYPFDSHPFRNTALPPGTQLPLVISKPSGRPMSSDGCAWSCSLLDVKGRDVLMSCSWPDTPSFLVLARLNLKPTEESQWLQLGTGEGQPASLKLYNWKLLVLDPKEAGAAHKDYDYLDFEAILYLPLKEGKDDAKPPLVLFPHGGPHSSFSCDFMLNPAVFALCGFAVLCVNYRGSLGFGQDSISSLLGNVGNFDVKDCMLAMQKAQRSGLVDADNVFVYGGSHGGFLSAQLIGQYPDQFRAASMRNPVINLTSMAGTTDIPDWVFTEAGLKFDHGSLATEDLLGILWRASPVSHVDKVKTPVMLHVGLKDLRVPALQSLEYYKMLKARNVPVQCHTYAESNHSLSEVEVEADSLVNTILWFAKHLSAH
ncbi:hypothetical protein ACOMHN_022210 [Nucella lapillus]